jgi:5'-3' exonuclease
MTTLIVVDSNAFFHSLVAQIEKYKIPANEIEIFCNFNLRYLYSGGLFSNYLAPNTKIQMVFVMDTKPYWRELLLKEIGINYKQNRQAKPQSVSLLATVKGIITTTLHNKKIPMFASYTRKSIKGCKVSLGYEADDIASAIARYTCYKSLYDEVIFFTDDSDWLAFTELNHTWIGIHHRHPRVRNEEICMHWIKNFAFDFHRTKVRRAYTALHINKPTDIWEFKAYFGDNADNLPGDKSRGTPGVFRPFIHLFDPMEGFDLYEDSNFENAFNTCVSPVHKVADSSLFENFEGTTPLFSTPVEPLDRYLEFLSTQKTA